MLAFCGFIGNMRDALAWLALPVIVMTAITFAALGTWLSSRVRSFDHFNYLWGFYIAPAFLVTGIFFPVDTLPRWIQAIALVFPTMYVVEPLRHALWGGFTGGDAARLWIMAGITWGLWQLGVRAMARRLVA